MCSCAMCHTRVMPNGTTLKGAQGNMPIDRALAGHRTSALRKTRLGLERNACNRAVTVLRALAQP